MIKTIEWTDDGVVMLDQRVLPREEVYLTFTLPEEVIEAIANLVIRGAPAIGVAAAMGMGLGAAGADAPPSAGSARWRFAAGGSPFRVPAGAVPRNDVPPVA